MVKTKFRHKAGLFILSLIVTAAILEIVLRVGGWAYMAAQEYQNQYSRKVSGGGVRREYHILCLGESTTAFGGETSYPRQLEKILNFRGTIKFIVINKGVPATTTDQIVDHLESYIRRYKPDLIAVMMGVNDTSKTPAYHSNRAGNSFFAQLKIVKLFCLIQQHLAHTRQDVSEDRALIKELNIAQDEVQRSPSSSAYVKLAKSYGRLQEFQKQKEALEKALALSADNYAAYAQLAEYYRNSDELALAEQQYQKALSLPNTPQGFKLGLLSALADCYYDEQKYARAEAIYQKLLSVFPPDAKGERVLYCDLLTDVYMKEEKYDSAIQIFEQRLALEPKGIPAYMSAAYAYRKLKRFDELEQILQKAIAIHSPDTEHYFFLYSELGYCLLENKKYKQAQQVFEQMRSMDPQGKGEIRVDVDYGLKLAADALSGKVVDANVPSHAAKESYYLPATIENYLQIKEIIFRHGIKFAAVQYPMRSLGPLKEILGSDPRIMFIDNEGLFKKAVAESSYADYFVDHFGGDFGHCTAKGNSLLAGNIADAIGEAVK